MPANPWTTLPERTYLLSQITPYRNAQSAGTLAQYWVNLDSKFFEHFPVEPKLGLPPRVEGDPPLTPEQLKVLGDEMARTKARLKSWLNYHSHKVARGGGSQRRGRKHKGLFKAMGKKKKTRSYRDVEIYHSLYTAKVKAEAMQRGYGDLNEEAVEAARHAAAAAEYGSVVILTEEETIAKALKEEEEALACIKEHRALRMAILRTSAAVMLANESPEVKAQIAMETAQLNADRVGDNDIDGERSPDGIEQLPEVLSTFADAVEEETGWHGFLMLGGPTPCLDGGISIKTVCFSATPEGVDFAASIDSTGIKKKFIQYLKRAFTHEVHNARGLNQPTVERPKNPALDDLIALDPRDYKEPEPAPVVAKPKRICRPKVNKNNQSAPLPAAPGPAPLGDSPVVLLPSVPAWAPSTSDSPAPPTPVPVSPTPFNPFLPLAGDVDAVVPNYVGFGDPNLDMLMGGGGGEWFGDDDSTTGGVATFDENGNDIVPPPRPAPPHPTPRPMYSGADVNRPIGGSQGLTHHWTDPLSLFRLPADWAAGPPASPPAPPPPLPPIATQAVAPIPVVTPTPSLATETPGPSAFFTASLSNNSAVSFQVQSASSGQASATPDRTAPRLEYMQSRPMGNPPKPPVRVPAAKSGGKAKKAGGKGGVAKENDGAAVDPAGDGIVAAPPKRGVGRLRKHLLPAVDAPPATAAVSVQAGEPALPPLTGAAAQAESAQLRHLDREQREVRAEVLRHEKAMVDAASASARKRKEAGGYVETLLVVERPLQAAKAALYPDGSPVIRVPNGSWGEMRVAEELDARRDLDAERAAADAVLLSRLQGPCGKAADVPPLVTRGAKRKAEESVAAKARPAKKRK
ncbi:hypothetical protein B0H14DRAFT_3457447 [Mycena olivaceomarginata]|nr:hypothetical protein B0H14DRAFT_3457447 [Mycena olivaceomarginata]